MQRNGNGNGNGNSNSIGQRGITLIETAIATSIASIALAGAMSGFGDMRQRHRLEGQAHQLVTDLQHLRLAAASHSQGLRVRFDNHTEGSCYVMHSGASGGCRCDNTGAWRSARCRPSR